MTAAYFRALFEAGKHGDAREESFYSPLATLVEAMAALHDKTGLHVTTLPKQTEAGNPDFRVWDGRARITGYTEAKKPDANLDQVETFEQLKRYLHTFPNVILTDFYEFRLDRDGQRLARVVAGQAYERKRDSSVFYGEAMFYSAPEVCALLSGVGFVDLECRQTVFRHPGKMQVPDRIEPGFGEGAFVVVRGVKSPRIRGIRCPPPVY